MNSKERVHQALNHQTPDRIPIDFGSTAVTGIHCLIVEKLRGHYGLEKRPVKVVDPYQMLGEVDAELAEAMGVDVIGAHPRNNLFGFPNENWKAWVTPWGQTVQVGGDFYVSDSPKGGFYMHPGGDPDAPPSGHMPSDAYFFDSIIRQDPIQEDKLNPEDNLEEFSRFTDEDIAYWTAKAAEIENIESSVIGNMGGTALGDIALVPAPFAKHPKGIRDVSEWYMSTVMRPDYVKTVFEKQTDIALENLKVFAAIMQDRIDSIFICGTDFGTQDSQFCSADTFRDLWLPYYKKMNDWIHAHTNWKTFKHCCGAVEPFLPLFIDAGFDIINPVQVNAKGMDPQHLKNEYGRDLVFWGGGVDTQKMLPYGKPDEVREQVLKHCGIFGIDGGFVFNTVHNIQANVPVENVVAMIEAVREFNE